MAERPKGYGMTADLAEKKAAKFDPDLAREAIQWISDVTGVSEIASVNPTPTDIVEAFKNGVWLCNLINIIQPGSVRKINESKMAFKMMENIGNFLSACEAYGLTKADIFQTVDLYEGENIPQFVNAIHALGRKVGKKNPSLPSLGPKESDKNAREFSEQQLSEGKAIIGLQMGSNRGASQAGMTPAGLGRQTQGVNLKGVQYQ